MSARVIDKVAEGFALRTAQQFVGRSISDETLRSFFGMEPRIKHRDDVWPVYRDAFRVEHARLTKAEAAEDLYAALTALLQRWEDEHNYNEESPHMDVARQARAALAKATGGKP